jgi:hypothetical protein
MPGTVLTVPLEVATMLTALLAEPPLRRVAQLAARLLPVSVATKDRWNAADRPHYLAGVLYAAQQAKREGRDAISVIEFGVADGYGLLALQAHAEAVERETGVRVAVYGFDSGGGMPAGTGDYRDHPDVWASGDYVMNVAALKAKLTARTSLVLGPIAETVMTTTIFEPLGFVSVDVDYYSSTVDALSLLACTPALRRTAMYFDDLSAHYNHQEAGELLAIREFNEKHAGRIIIDRWRGLAEGRPFPEASWLEAMYLAHDLAAISRARKSGPASRMR